jgi:hypothetical protein
MLDKSLCEQDSKTIVSVNYEAHIFLFNFCLINLWISERKNFLHARKKSVGV